MRYPTLALGERNAGVRALQYGLHRALAKRGLPHGNLRNGMYGSLTKQDVLVFKINYGITPRQGKTFGGSGEWRALEPFLGKWDKIKLARRNATIIAERARAAALARIARAVASELAIVAVSLRFYDNRYRYHYRQTRPMPSELFSSTAYYRLDCSSTCTLIFKAAGAPDPNGRGYDGYGYTGTLWPRGTYVGSDCKAGDLAFYGYMSDGNPSHVATCISSSEIVSFGSTPPHRLPLRYRNDFRGCRRYPLR
jgi:hypothetical protein